MTGVRGYLCRLATVFGVLGLVSPARAAGPVPPGAAASCAAAAAAAERRHGLPPGLLLAIGKVESGRPTGSGGAIGPWPWSVDIDGQDFTFADQASAIAMVRRAQAGGESFIDVGCFQIDLHFHPEAFASLQDAFDPDRNAEAAARFLVQLHAQFGDWAQAAGAYHSQSTALAGPYRRRVMLAWGVAGGAATAEDTARAHADQTLALLQGAWRATLPGDGPEAEGDGGLHASFSARAPAIPPTPAMLEFLPIRSAVRPALQMSARRVDGKGPES